MIEVKEAHLAYRLLNGIFCAYKANQMPFKLFKSEIRRKLCFDLNTLQTRPCNEMIQISGNVGVDDKFEIHRSLSLADHPLVVGQRYNAKNFDLNIYQNLGWYVSGLTLVGIGPDGFNKIIDLRNRNPIKEYEITCRLGLATHDFTEVGNPIRKANLKFVTPFKINTLCNVLVHANSRYLHRRLGIRMQTEEAYNLLSKGPVKIRSKNSDPILYSMKCVEFDPPYCKLRINCVNENILYFYHLVNNMGIKLKSYACVNKVTLTRLGKFTIDDSLSYKEITLEKVINNILRNEKKVEDVLLENSVFNEFENIKFNKRTALQETTNSNFDSPLVNLE